MIPELKEGGSPPYTEFFNRTRPLVNFLVCVIEIKNQPQPKIRLRARFDH